MNVRRTVDMHKLLFIDYVYFKTYILLKDIIITKHAEKGRE